MSSLSTNVVREQDVQDLVRRDSGAQQQHLRSHEPAGPVAILDKEIHAGDSFCIGSFEMCSLCGARFGIGYFGSRGAEPPSEEFEELPRKLIEILARDHWHSRQHKGLIELNY